MDRNALVCAVSAAAASAVSVLAYRYLTSRNDGNVYETQKLVNEYLNFHYGRHEEVLRYDFGPKGALDFPLRCAQECIHFADVGIAAFDVDALPRNLGK